MASNNQDSESFEVAERRGAKRVLLVFATILAAFMLLAWLAGPDDPKLGEYVYVEELPEAITKVSPEYPASARQANVDGTVLLQVLVGKDGKVKDAKVVKSVAMLDAAAMKAVKKWIFKPALSNNKPVAVWVAIPMKFTLN